MYIPTSRLHYYNDVLPYDYFVDLILPKQKRPIEANVGLSCIDFKRELFRTVLHHSILLYSVSIIQPLLFGLGSKTFVIYYN